MIKNRFALIPLVLFVTGGSIQAKAYFEQLSLDDIISDKKLDMDFDNNLAFNKINNKTYLPTKTTAKYVSSLKGNAFEGNNSKINIPFSDLGISEKNPVITVSFLFKWDGTDTNFFPISLNGDNGLGSNNIWFRSGCFGFNTGNSEVYGISNVIEKNKYYSIVAEFNLGDTSKNILYIDGVKQNISYVYGTSSRSSFWDANSSFTISGYALNETYNITDKSVIDEVKLFSKSLTQQEILEVTNSHKIPELQTELVDNKYTKLDWVTEILPENVFWKVGYESDEQTNIDLVYNVSNGLGDGGQKFTTNTVYTGNYSLYTPQTRPDKGNWLLYPFTGTSISNHVFYLGDTVTFNNDDKISISYRVKTDQKASIRILADWRYEKKFTPYYVTTTSEVKKGSKVIPVSDASGFSYSMRLSFDSDPNVIENSMQKTVEFATVSENTITLTSGVPYDIPAGTELYYRKSYWAFDDSTKNINPSDKWQLINFNTGITHSDYIDWSEYALNLRQGWATYGDTYLDDLKVGYATKVRIYRDNDKIYEGYESTFDDKTAIDTSPPNNVNKSSIKSTIQLINANTSQRRINFSFETVTDKGNTYNYQITSIDKQGLESPKSETNTQTIISGIKGYSYVIDKNPLTIPSNTVNTTSTTISKDITDTGVYYLHIKTIDNAGNVSGTVHYEVDIPTLTAKANPSEDMIRLDWAMNDIKNKSFKVYKKSEQDSDFQSISMTNLDTSNQVRVLNIYPTYNIPLKDDGSVDLNNKPLNKSAMLEDWIKDYGMGVITVDSINKEDFESNPNKWLKDESGEYKYDVVVVGFWNINVREQHLNNTGSDAIGEFIDSGRGVLAGHHHMGYREFDYGLNRLKTKFGVKLIKEEGAYQTELGNIDYVLPEKSPGTDNSYYWNLGTQVKATKKGILLNYPHNIAQEGKVFTVPKGHDTWEFAMGDVWMQYVNQNAYVIPFNLPAKDITMLPDGSAGTSNSYLHTYNNTAIIQTGHSNNNATEDEKKIVANTIFYLNQLSTENFLNDNSGQDVTAPNKPIITNHSFTSRGNVEINFNEVKDNGTTYSYYVQSEDRNGQVAISNTATETIASGLKGYSYVVDSYPLTIPDNEIELTKAQSINVSITDNSAKYIHIRAVDNVGNVSDTFHYKITETTKPILNITGNPTEWTNSDVIFRINAEDLDSGIDCIILPNGSMVADDFASYIVTTNGDYTFKAVDKMGNITTETISVTKIDKTSPTLTYTKVINSTKTQANINLSFNDTASGFDYLELPNGTKITDTTTHTHTYTVIENGIYLFTAYDKVGNKTTLSVEVFELVTQIYPSNVSKIEYKLEGATVQNWTIYTVPFYISNEGITTITSRSYDNAGNISEEKISTVKIDKTIPNNNFILIQLN